MPVTPTTVERLRALAAQWEAKGLEAAERLDEDATRAAFRRMVFYTAQADQLEAELEAAAAAVTSARQRRPLPTGEAAPIIDSQPTMFTAEHRKNMSKAQAPRGRSAKLAALAWKLDPPLSLAGLAKKVGISPSLITKAANGVSPMPETAAKKIQDLTGYPITAWPRLS